MRSTRIAVAAAALGSLALPMAATGSAAATTAPVSSMTPVERPCERPGPWVIGTTAVTIRSKASAKSTSVGILYRGHKFSVHKSSGGWRYITDKTTGVKGWVSGAWVYRDVRMCLN
ncbi:SH3 domain-containing protein [Streptomyces anulatus]|uniref:SH3 domain-containing protein n=1 Tax=Streptomyces anulatus TaxID=1892 RepID=UPI0033D0A87E